MTLSDRHADLEAYVDGELDVAARAAVDIHVASCAACRAELDALQVLQQRLAAHPVPDPGARYWADFTRRVEARLHPASEPAHGWERLVGWLFPRGHFAWLRATGALAASTLLVYVGLRGFDSERAHLRAPSAPVRVQQEPTAPGPIAVPPPEAPEAGANDTHVDERATASKPSGATAPVDLPSAVLNEPPSDADHARLVQPAPSAPTQSMRGGRKEVAPAPPAPVPPTAQQKSDFATAPPAVESQADGKLQDKSPGTLAVGEVAPSAAASESRSAPHATAPEAAPRKDRQAGADPVAEFLIAASGGDVVQASVLAASAAAPADEQLVMQRWVRLRAPSPAPAPPGSTGALVQQLNKSAKKMTLASGASSSEVESLLLLDELATPRRGDPAVRTSVVRITTGLLPHADDPRVVSRVRSSLEWLAATSTTDAERQHWRSVLDSWPAH